MPPATASPSAVEAEATWMGSTELLGSGGASGALPRRIDHEVGATGGAELEDADGSPTTFRKAHFALSPLNIIFYSAASSQYYIKTGESISMGMIEYERNYGSTEPWANERLLKIHT